MGQINNRPISIWVISSIAILFGLVTIKAGGAVLFFNGQAREAAGNYVPFVIGSNFIMGFLYIMAGINIWLLKKCSIRFVALITTVILIVYAAFGIHIFMGGLYEMQTVYAMGFRFIVWSCIFAYLWKYSQFQRG